MIVEMQENDLKEFLYCELGAHEDGIKGPSNISTYEILDRHNAVIELRTPEEAAQVADAIVTGTADLFIKSVIIKRVYKDCLAAFPTAHKIRSDYDKEQWEILFEQINKAQTPSQT